MARNLYRRLPLSSLFSELSQRLEVPITTHIGHLERRNNAGFWGFNLQANLCRPKLLERTEEWLSPHHPQEVFKVLLEACIVVVPMNLKPVSRSYARGCTNYDLFGGKRPGDQEFRKAWAEDVGEDDCLWTGSDEDDSEDNVKHETNLKREMKKVKNQAKENSDLIDADDSDELRSLCSDSDEEMTLWSGSECDDDDDIPTEPHPNERSDPHIDKLFEFEETPKFRTLAEMLKAEQEPPELSPGKQARKLAVENALKKLKKGPDGRYINVWEVMSDIDILIGAFENIVSGPEYAELREGGPKKLNMQFFKDIQARMRDPNFKFSPELKLKPKSKLVPKKKWQKAQSRRRKNERR